MNTVLGASEADSIPAEFRHVFAPLNIGPVEVRNRFYMTPHGAGFVVPDPSEPGFNLPAPNTRAYYLERAAGGVGLIIQGGTIIDHASMTYGNWQLFSDNAVEAWTPIVSAVHDAGARMFVQLMQQGHHGDHGGNCGGPLSPSTVPPVEGEMVWTPFTPLTVPVKAMDHGDIRQVVESFGHCTRNAGRAGYDGVELHASHGYLVEQFLSPFYNKRQDDYGGSLENRMRFLMECLDAMRDALQPHMALGLRLNCAEDLPGGLTTDELAEIAHRIDASGVVDYFDLDVGTYHSFEMMIAPALQTKPHWQLDQIRIVRGRIANALVLGCPGRLHDPTAAETLVANGELDMVGGTRGFFAEPAMAAKALAGRAADIRPCIGLNVCLAEDGCAMNPAKGREDDLGEATLTTATTRRRVVIVGGGPSGLEAARVAALRGHTVTLIEAQADVGGALRLMAQVPGREDVVAGARWWLRQLQDLEVTVRLNTVADRATVLAESPDVLVVAAGSVFDRSGATGFVSEPVTGWDQPHVIAPENVLGSPQSIRPGDRAVLVDEFGSAMSACVALALAAQGSSLTWVTRHPNVGHAIGGLQWPAVWRSVRSHDIALRPNTYVRRIEAHTVALFDVYDGAEVELEDIDKVVMMTGRQPCRELVTEVSGSGVEIHVVGDARFPRGMAAATEEGHRLGRAL